MIDYTPPRGRQGVEPQYVYRCLSCPRVWMVPSGVPLRCDACGSKDREHVASVDPPLRLLAILNAEPAERDRLIAETRGEVKL